MTVNELLRDGRGLMLGFDVDPRLIDDLGLRAVQIRPDGIATWVEPRDAAHRRSSDLRS